MGVRKEPEGQVKLSPRSCSHPANYQTRVDIYGHLLKAKSKMDILDGIMAAADEEAGSLRSLRTVYGVAFWLLVSIISEQFSPSRCVKDESVALYH